MSYNSKNLADVNKTALIQLKDGTIIRRFVMRVVEANPADDHYIVPNYNNELADLKLDGDVLMGIHKNEEYPDLDCYAIIDRFNYL